MNARWNAATLMISGLVAFLATSRAIVGQVDFSFLPRTVWPDPGAAPYSGLLALADFDHDRDLDLLGSLPLRVYPYVGSGAFGPGVSLQSCSPFGVGIGDVDGDGHLDLLAPNASPSPTCAGLFLGDGRGGFVAAAAGLPPIPQLPHCMVAALCDVDGDGDSDAILGSNGPLYTSPILLNDGTGRFTDSPSRAIPPPPASFTTREIQAADLDGDGDQDLVFGALGHTTYASRIYVNDGTGHFHLSQEFLADPTGFRIRLGDVDADGDLDFVMWGVMQTPRLYLNDGTGRFTRTSGRLPTQGIQPGGDLGDVDGDGDLDIVTGYYYWLVPPAANPGEYRILALWLNDGTGHFVDASATTPTVAQALYAFPTVDLGDIDGDGDLDIFTGFGPALPTHSEVLWNLKRHLYPPQEAHLGRVYELEVWADAGHVAGTFLAFGGAHFDLGALGVFGLDPATTFTLPARLVPPSRKLTYRFPISTDPVLLGLTLHWQAIDVDPNDLTKSRLMAKYEDTVLP